MQNVKRVLIMGATGCLGQNATEQLLANKLAEVRASGRDGKIGHALTARGAEFIGLDVRSAGQDDFEQLVNGCDAVWYCAGTHYAGANIGADEHEAVNFRAVVNLFKAAKALKTVRRFIYISSSELYDDAMPQLDIDESYRSHMGPSHYLRTKLMAEAYLKSECSVTPTIRHSIIRPSFFYGPYDRHTLPQLVDEVRREGRLILPRGGDALKDFTYVGNVVYAMYLATVSPFSRGETYNISDGAPVKIKEFLEELFKKAGIPFKVSSRPLGWMQATLRLDDMKGIRGKVVNIHNIDRWSNDFTLNIEHATDQLAYAPFVPMDEAISLTADWLKQRYTF